MAVRKSTRLAHGWRLANAGVVTEETLNEFVRPAVHALPRSMASRLGPCRVTLSASLPDPALSSEWAETADGIEIALRTDATEPHDLAMELLVCLGEALWEKLSPAETNSFLGALREEIDAGVTGEIDEDSLAEKRLLLSSRVLARSTRRLELYARASFAGTAAEYVHSLWHEVTVRAGPDYLPPEWLRRRLEMLARWFPPGRGQRLFARS